MTRFRFAAVMTFLAWAVALAAPASAADRTNLVLIMTDDQGSWSMGCYGNPEAHTPVLDKLATNGVRMTRAFANCPVCATAGEEYLAIS